MRKKGVSFILLSMVMIMNMCGCGNDAGSFGSKTASGGAVAEKDTSERASKEAIPENIAYSKKSPYLNTRNYYEDMENGCKQMKFDGTLVREIPFAGKGASSLLSVTDSEIFYIKPGTYATGEYEEELWSIPIEKTADGDRPLAEKAKFILKDESVGWAGYFYADENYIVHIVPYEFKVFDRKAGKYIKLKGEPVDKKSPPNNVDYFSDCVCGNNILFQCKHVGLYMYTLGSDKIVSVDKRTHGAYAAVAYDRENQIIYERCDACEEFDKNPKYEHQVSLYTYDCETGEKQKLVSEDVWKKVYEENGIKDAKSSWGEMYLDGDTLYSAGGDSAFSFDLSGDRTPHYEEKFSEWLKKSKYHWYDVREIENGKCYFTDRDDDEEEYIAGYYDLQKNSYVKTDKFCRR